MSILSNHATSSVVRVEGEIDINDLNRGDYSGEEVAKRMDVRQCLHKSIFIGQQHITKES